MTTPTKPRPGPGRPRAFYMDAVLDRAVRVFSERGYHATSIGDLAKATGLAQGSLYKAFKDKKSIFLAAFDRYRAKRRRKLDAALAPARTGRQRVFEIVRFYADASEGREGRRGCLVAGSAGEVAVFEKDAVDRVASALDSIERLVGETIEAGQRDGSIPSYVDTAQTARAILCLLQGMRVVGKARSGKSDMDHVVAVAMKMLD